MHKLAQRSSAARPHGNCSYAQIRGLSSAVTSARAPYVDEHSSVSIYAGEAIELSLDRNDVTRPKFLRTIEHVDTQGLKGYQKNAPPVDPSAPALLSLEFRQSADKPSMSLVLRNETGVPLKYDVTMFVPTPDGMKSAHTSTCPILPGSMGDESWPHPIAMLLLTNFRRADMDGAFTCE